VATYQGDREEQRTRPCKDQRVTPHPPSRRVRVVHGPGRLMSIAAQCLRFASAIRTVDHYSHRTDGPRGESIPRWRRAVPPQWPELAQR